MTEKIKIDSFPIKVPFRGPGNVVAYKEVDFDIYKLDGHFEAVPLCSQQDRVLASIPPQLTFKVDGGKAQSPKGIKDGNQGLLNDLAQELVNRQLVE